MIRKLYILGNGFDLHHGIKSSYGHFKQYVQQVDDELFKALEKYFNPDNLWWEFEKELEYLDTDQIVDEASNYLESYGHEKWKESMHHDYQYEIGIRIDMVTERLKKRFTEWIFQLSIPDENEISFLGLDTSAFFLTFNYTRTLEKLYGLTNEKILYIHNKIVDTDSNLILGHSRQPSNANSFNRNSSEDDDPRVTEGNELLDSYFRYTYKTTEKIIEDNKLLFNSLSEVNEIFVLGHSMAEVDAPYFIKIFNAVDGDKVQWNVSYFSDDEKLAKRKFLEAIGVPPDNITIEKIEAFDSISSIQLKIDI